MITSKQYNYLRIAFLVLMTPVIVLIPIAMFKTVGHFPEEKINKLTIICHLMNGRENLSQDMCIAQLEAENALLAERWDVSEYTTAELVDAILFIYEMQREARNKKATDIRIDLTTKDASVDQVLTFLAIENPGISFVVAECISSQLINLQLKDVPWESALREVLRTVGLRFAKNHDGTVYRMIPLTAESPP